MLSPTLNLKNQLITANLTPTQPQDNYQNQS